MTLYLKYRPQAFADVVGQDHIVTTLEQAVNRGRISHAYLFCGSRGTGKTSVARILAKTILLQGIEDPKLREHITKAVEDGSFVDLIEIDAASNRRIDDVRDLVEKIGFSPAASKAKVYIVDEVHMLTKEAFNAFLKTLEEPPAHAIFILATTEVEKVPETIRSRCQVFTFKKPTQKILRDMVVSVAKKEGFSLEPSSADLIALLAEGSFRDAQGILQKIFSSSKDKKVSVEEVETVTGAPRADLLNALLEAFEQGSAEEGLGAVSKAVAQGSDMKVFMRLLLERVRAVLLLRFAKDIRGRIEEEFSERDFSLISKIAGTKETRINAALLRRLLETQAEVTRAYIPHLPLELAVIELCEGQVKT